MSLVHKLSHRELKIIYIQRIHLIFIWYIENTILSKKTLANIGRKFNHFRNMSIFYLSSIIDLPLWLLTTIFIESVPMSSFHFYIPLTFYKVAYHLENFTKVFLLSIICHIYHIFEYWMFFFPNTLYNHQTFVIFKMAKEATKDRSYH